VGVVGEQKILRVEEVECGFKVEGGILPAVQILVSSTSAGVMGEETG
jgi:hypothetical protein